ncbi:MerR family DNA-binding transcriptional regulator [Nocardia thailandica]|uniref:MerR family DNA-binding transcriptional regulator n=1 Tax=Nocardia thailandica TaxID=257275 RepID=UPI0002E3CE37|nr:MerR family DNA-binding transcriptional regulator [Nocardia thailandica]
MLIGEVSRRSGVSTRMLRHYDALGLVQPSVRTPGGYREYSADDLRRLFHVECLRTLGLSLGDAGRALDEPGFAPSELVGDLIRHTRARIAAEQELLRHLERIDAAAPAQWGDVLEIVPLLRGLDSEDSGRRQRAVLSQRADGGLPVEALVAAALSEDNPNVAGALRWSLARSAGAGLAELAAGLADADVAVRRRAVLAVAAVPTAAATDVLRPALADADAAVRDRAALALGGRQVPAAVPALLAMVIAGRSDVEAAETLGLLAADDPETADTVLAALGRALATGDAPTRVRVTQALAEIPGGAARAVLSELTGDADRAVAGTATAILRHHAPGA